MAIVRFQDIIRYTRDPNYSVTVDWSYLEIQIAHHSNEEQPNSRLDLEPDFQRAHVWDDERRARYVEFILRGGASGKDLLFNCAGWMTDWRGPYVIVDGKQRLEAVRRFLRNELPVNFPELSKEPLYRSDFKDPIRGTQCYFNWKVNDLPTRRAVLRWYLEINSGGVVHTPEELGKVREMLAAEPEDPPAERLNPRTQPILQSHSPLGDSYRRRKKKG